MNNKLGADVQKSGTENAYKEIRAILENARSRAYVAVNSTMVRAYWEIGRVIVGEEQKGKIRAEYGKRLIDSVSIKLSKEFGAGFNERNLWHMRNFYLKFKKVNALRTELSWIHYRLLLSIDDKNALEFYLTETANNRWSTRELDRQISAMLYEQLALSKDKSKLKELAVHGQILKMPAGIIKDPHVLEFLQVKENETLHENKLEELLTSKLKDFLLELGKGFSFVARQKRITVDGEHYHVDLVFYNYILKCFVLVDLKVGKLTHQDIGQMDFYVRYFEKEEKQAGDNPSIGMILCSNKNEAMVKYTLLAESRNIFASKYKLYLPTEKELVEELKRERSTADLQKIKSNKNQL
ncbi:MAG: PDDEXK nuclease domain-containing protein [Candidatus Micrarchaeota archaeon]